MGSPILVLSNLKLRTNDFGSSPSDVLSISYQQNSKQNSNLSNKT
jgi:hypothetical protein